MAILWFYQRGGRPSGPVDSRQLRRLAEAGIVTPNTLVRKGATGRWVRAENVRGLFQRSTPESPIRHCLDAAEVNDASEKPDRIWPVTWVAIIAGSGAIIVSSGTVLLFLWALVFRGGSEPQRQAEKDQPPLAAAQSAESGASAPIPEGWELVAEPSAAAGPAAESKSVPSTGNVKILELTDLAELVGPSVVQVNVTGPEGAFTGSGFVLDKQGTIVTNFHVIEDATAGRIVFSDRTSAPITGYLGVWPEKDIALVRVKCPPDKLHPLRLATSAPRQGERVAAFGSPLGLQQSVSEGIVSAVRESEEVRALGQVDVNARLIQTTTPISHGNSGGPLVDMKGMVVGVNTMTLRPLGGENVNFAVAVVELPPLLLAKSETPSPLPASDPAANGVRRILRRAEAHIDAGDYDSAIADYTEAIRLDPKNAKAYDARGWVYALKDEFDRAIADHTYAIRLDPKNAFAYFRRGLAYGLKGDSDSAIADLTDAIRLDPTNADVYEARGWDYGSKGDFDRAIADFTEAIRLDPQNADLYCSRGFNYRIKRDYDSSIADYTEAIRLDPQNAEAYHGRGLAYQKKGQRAAAERDFRKAKELGYEAPTPVPPERNPVGESPIPIRRVYAATGEGHWINKKIGRGEFIVLEDGSLWEIDRLDRIDASLWLRMSDITVVESNGGSPGYEYLLINTDDGEKAHAKYMGKR